MALTGPPIALSSGSHTAVKLRQLWGSLLLSSGVAAPGDCLVKQRVSASQGILVAAGGIFLKGTSSSVQGDYGDFNDADYDVAATASDGSQTRIDRVIYRVRDPDYVSGTPINAFEWLQGVAGSGTPPSVPADSVSLAQVARAAGSGGNTLINSNITDERTFAVALGGATRGWKQTGAPVAGTYLAGAFGFDAAGNLWLCTTGGTPGTWVPTTSVRFASQALSGSPVNVTIPSGFREVELSWIGQASSSVNMTLEFNADASAGNYFENGFSLTGSGSPGSFDYEGAGVPFIGRSGSSGSIHRLRFRGPISGGLSWTWYLGESSWYDNTSASMQQARYGGLYKGSPITQVTIGGTTWVAGTLDARGYS